MSNRGIDKEYLIGKYGTSELIEYLNEVIDTEIKKSEEMDSDLVRECVDWLLEIRGVEIKISEAEIKNRAQSIVRQHYSPKNRWLRFKYMKMIAAVVFAVLIVSSANILSVSFGYRLTDGISLLGKSIIGIIQQEKATDEHADFIWTQEIKVYDNILTAARENNLNILYPRWFPAGYILESVTYTDYGEYMELMIIYTAVESYISLIISTNKNMHDLSAMEADAAVEKYTADNITHYIYQADISVQAVQVVWNIGGYYYSLTCSDVGEAKKIINSLYD